MHKQMGKFFVIGLSGVAINLIILFLLVEFLRFPYMLSAFFAYVVSITNNFFWNKHWTFNNREQRYKEQYVRYLTISGFSLLINLAALYVFVEVIQIWYMFAQLAALFLAGSNNFLWAKFWAFKY